MRSLIAFSRSIFVVVFAACAAEAHQSDVAAGSAPAAAPIATPPAASVTTALAVSPQPRVAPVVDPAARLACDSVARRWIAVAGATLLRMDTVLGPDDVITDAAGDSTVIGADSSAPKAACAVVGTRSAGLDSAGRAKLYWPAAGWGRVWRLSADGPDGQVQTYQRGRVRCQVADQWDGGDDADTTVVLDPFFRQQTLCWRHPRALIPADTTQGSL